MSDSVKEFALVLSIVFIAVATMVATISAIDAGVRSYTCRQYHNITGKNTRYVLFDSCYVSTPTGWQRWDEYTARATASEGLSQ